MNPHYFIAISLPIILKEKLNNIQSNLESVLPYQLWTYKEDLHITVKFLGEADIKNIQELKEKLNHLTTLRSFKTKIKSIGYFGREAGPRILWAGVQRNQEMENLKKEVEWLTHKKFDRERREFKPHITLAKKWNGTPNKKVIKNIADEYKNECFLLTVSDVTLYKIEPKNYPKYKAICTYRLKE